MSNHDELLTRAVETVVPRDLAEKKLKSGKPIRLYLGIDPTGNKLHIGHSVPLRKLKAFQEAGHEVIFLIGSFTAMVGDPTGRDAMRVSLTKEQVEENFKTYKKQAAKILDFEKLKIVYNHEWLEKMSFAEIMKLASHFTVQQMLEREMFRKRMTRTVLCKKCRTPIPLFKSSDVSMEQIQGDRWPFSVTCGNCGFAFTPLKKEILEEEPISPNEFLYPLMQGYDSVMLDVDCEVGGNDQLFNMLCGRKLQKVFGKREKFILTTKLIEGTDGRKMSKTYDNCVYIDDEPADMFGKVMSVNDDLMATYFECCTDVALDEVKKILKGSPRDAKARLAREITTLYHGADAATKAEQAFDRVFKNKGLPEDMPEVKVKKGTLLVDVLVSSKLVTSKSEARRVIEQGGVKLNKKVIQSIEQVVEEGTVQVGKRKFARLSVSS
ncbi:MAG: tyrosine--tRNA ligase [Candidatus Peregrinibacteria bacterium]